jgi:hypothetical protein
MIKLTDLLNENKILIDYPLKDNYINTLISKDSPELYIDKTSTTYTNNNQLKNINSPFYDFGGGAFSINSPNNTVVDYSGEDNEYGAEFNITDYTDAEDNINPVSGHQFDNYIDADLRKYIKLPPKNAINITDALYNFNDNPSTIAKTIDDALLPGGLLVISDHLYVVSKLLKKLPSYKLLELNIRDWDEYEGDQYQLITVVLKKQ